MTMHARSLLTLVSLALALPLAGCLGDKTTDPAAAGSSAAASKDGAAKTDGAKPGDAAPPEPKMSPAEFLQFVAQEDMLQLDLGRKVVEQGETDKVKAYAKRIVTNHTAIEVIARKLAGKEAVELPAQVDAAGEAKLAEFKDLRGVALDKAYCMYMAEAQAKTMAAYRWQYDNCKDDEVRSFAMQTMPIVGVHARVSDELNKDINKEELRLAAEKKAADEKAAEEKRIADAMAAAQKNAKKQPPQKKSMLRPKPQPAADPEAEASPESSGK
jgi:putative membrane protein